MIARPRVTSGKGCAEWPAGIWKLLKLGYELAMKLIAINVLMDPDPLTAERPAP